MEILVILIPISIVLIGIAAATFIWAVNHNQFNDLDKHGFDALDDTADVTVARSGSEKLTRETQ